jgi:RNA polymerase sigma-70 factor, ECF subfamily
MMQPTRLDDMAETKETDDAFRAFFEHEYLRLARAMFLVTGSHSEADDLAQEAMVRLFERWGRVRAMDSPTGYLYRVAMNLCRSRFRRLAVRARLAVTGGTPVDPAAVAEDRDTLGRALAALPTGQRAAIVLVEWLGLDDREAGRALGIQPGSVRVRVSRARATLRGRFGGDADG